MTAIERFREIARKWRETAPLRLPTIPHWMPTSEQSLDIIRRDERQRTLKKCAKELFALITALEAERAAALAARPKIVCLCGSTRFTKEMLIKQWELTGQGYIVLTWCALPDSYAPDQGRGVKEFVDEVHKRKIDLCDEVLVINIDGYIGESTRSEIEYAKAHGKPIQYLLAEREQATKEPKP